MARIKELETQLASEIEVAKKEAAQRIEGAKASRQAAFDTAAKKAQEEADGLMSEAVSKANAESEKISSRAESEVKALREKHSKNRKKAVEYILKELGA